LVYVAASRQSIIACAGCVSNKDARPAQLFFPTSPHIPVDTPPAKARGMLGSSPQGIPRVLEGPARPIECFWPRSHRGLRVCLAKLSGDLTPNRARGDPPAAPPERQPERGELADRPEKGTPFKRQPSPAEPSRAPHPGCRALRERDSVGQHAPECAAWRTASIPDN
jgi:hypothetical protein